jgi:hypothetical protein
LFSYSTATLAGVRPPNFDAKLASAIPLRESLDMMRKTQLEMPVRSGDVALVATAARRPS